ncbi:ATP-binding cassette domain-containing protein [Ewingella sp. S1.OA.A_B6]
MIELENVSIHRQGRSIIDGVSTRPETGSVNVIIGPNGTGKTTLLNAIFGELALAEGQIQFGGRTLLPGKIRGKVLHDLNLACQYADNLLVVARGEIQAAGKPREVVTAGLIAETYGVEVEVLQDRSGNPVIQPVSGTVESNE